MKAIFTTVFCLLLFSLSAQDAPRKDTIPPPAPVDTLTAMDSVDVFDTTKIELVKMFPEPFYDFLQFNFAVHDENEHTVKIYLANSQNELVYFEQVQVYKGHENIRISTIDLFLTGLYSIQIKIDNKYHYLRTFKRTRL